jgi:tRNA pseudouridine32 synthase / 23S rRNA pseudouridine746 synthase
MFEILEKHPDFWLVYKHPGTSFHSDSGEMGVFESIKQQAMQEGISTLFPVHRLDKVTSGLMLVATHEEANRELCAAFNHRHVEKYYLAISHKTPSKKQGSVIGDMEASRRGTWKLMTSKKNPAVTQFFSCSIAPHQRLFIVKPRTGKTHQIRVAMKSLGSAIAGDPLYSAQDASEFDRCYLHAYAIAFSLFGKNYRFTQLPKEGNLFLQECFLKAMQDYTEPWRLSWPVITI